MVICSSGILGAAIRQPDSFTKLHLRMNGEGNVFKDLTGKTVTTYGNANQNYNSPHFIGKIAYFDGSVDFLSIVNSIDFDFGTGDFTIEFFANILSVPDGTACTILGSNTFRLDYTPYLLRYLEFFGLNNGTAIGKVSGTGVAIAYGVTNHYAYVRSGNTFTMFLNCIPIKSVTDTASIGTPTGNTYIGRTISNDWRFNGYLSEFRISNIARSPRDFIFTRRK